MPSLFLDFKNRLCLTGLGADGPAWKQMRMLGSYVFPGVTQQRCCVPPLPACPVALQAASSLEPRGPRQLLRRRRTSTPWRCPSRVATALTSAAG